jgi:hypothetical protein
VESALKPAYAWLLHKYAPDGELSPTILATLVISLLASAMATGVGGSVANLDKISWG